MGDLWQLVFCKRIHQSSKLQVFPEASIRKNTDGHNFAQIFGCCIFYTEASNSIP